MAFTNPARRDGLVLHHWRRVADEGKEYPFAKFNKRLEMPVFNDMEYQAHLQVRWWWWWSIGHWACASWTRYLSFCAMQVEGWSRDETDHLLDLCRSFDLRFPVIQDRWDGAKYKKRSIEDLKERQVGSSSRLEDLERSCSFSYSRSVESL